MWSLVKLVIHAIVEAMVTATVFAIATILVLWGANGFPSASVADFVELIGWAGAIGTGIVLVLKLVEFAWVVRTLEVRARAFDSAWEWVYKALASGDIQTARYWVDKLQERQQPLYNILAHCAKWRGANTAVITSLQWQGIDRYNQARESLLVASASAWRPSAR